MSNNPSIVAVDVIALAAAQCKAIVTDAHEVVMENQGARVAEKVMFQSVDADVRVDVAQYERVTLKLIDWPVDELMYLLEGKVEISDSMGNSRVYGPGDVFLMPKGFDGTWKQLSTIKKIALSYSVSKPALEPVQAATGTSSNSKIVSIGASTLKWSERQMKPVEGWGSFLVIVGKTHARFVEVPVFKSVDGQLALHVKRFEQVTFKLNNWPIDEFMHFLSGHVEITKEGGGANTYGPGDTIVIPEGFRGTWRQEGTVDMITAAYKSRGK